MSGWVVETATDASVSCGVWPWRYRGRVQLTVVVKATFALVDKGAMAPAPPAEIEREDRTFDRHPTRSVEAVSDLSPYLPRCDVTFVGHAFPPAGAASSAARVALYRDGRALLDRTVHVFGERDEQGAPKPFTKMPLVYERAAGGPGVDANPVGRAAPLVIDPQDPKKPACFAPVSRFWAVRKRLLGGLDRKAVEAPLAEIPDAMPWAYFQAAPSEQQVEFLRGGEWLVLDGLHPTLARLQTQVPAARAEARIASRGGAGAAGGAGSVPVELVADGLAIDGDKGRCSIVWRGRHEVAGGEAAFAGMVVLAGLAGAGRAIAWDSLLAATGAGGAVSGGGGALSATAVSGGAVSGGAVSGGALSGGAVSGGVVSAAGSGGALSGGAVSGGAAEEAPAEGTLTLNDVQQVGAARKAVAPFAVAAPDEGPVDTSATPWSREPPRSVVGPPSGAAAMEETIGVMSSTAPGGARAPLAGPGSVAAPPTTKSPAGEVGESTMAVSAAVRPIAPFAVAQPGGSGAAGPASGAAPQSGSLAATPWGGAPIVAANREAVGEMTMGPGGALPGIPLVGSPPAVVSPPPVVSPPVGPPPVVSPPAVVSPAVVSPPAVVLPPAVVSPPMVSPPAVVSPPSLGGAVEPLASVPVAPPPSGAALSAPAPAAVAAPPVLAPAAPTFAASPGQAPAGVPPPAPAPPAPPPRLSLADRLKGAGASSADIDALLKALQPPPPPPPGDD